jgi:hypothetical protein
MVAFGAVAVDAIVSFAVLPVPLGLVAAPVMF